MRARVIILVTALLGAALAVFAWRGALPEIDVRALPHQTQFGRIFPGHPVGAGFVSQSGGLELLEIALVHLGGEATPLELTVRGEFGGQVLKQVTIPASELPQGDGWVRVELGIEARDEGSRTFFFELSSSAPSSHAPWVRYRATPHLVRPWGDRVLAPDSLEFELSLLPHRDLRALALAVDGLDAAAAPAFVEISDPRTGAVVRRGEVLQRSPQAVAWTFFTFEPLPESRWKPWNVRFELPPSARPVGGDSGPSLIAFHGRGVVGERMLGLTCGAARFADRDLIFRAWPDEDAPSGPAVWLERGGMRLFASALLFVAAAAVLGAWLQSSARRSAPTV